jgi:Kef-type K+ transport system membrane component KefB
MLHAVESFASVFVPFYFFHAGLGLRTGDFTPTAFVVGVVFLAAIVPLQLALGALHRRMALREEFRDSLRVGVPLVPTLVFTLVLAGILRERFDAPSVVVGGLVVYAIGNTLIPGFVFRVPPPEFETPGGRAAAESVSDGSVVP